MIKTLTPAEALALIRQQVLKAGSQKAFAEQHGISESLVEKTLNERRSISSTMASAVGLTTAKVYVTDDDK